MVYHIMHEIISITSFISYSTHKSFPAYILKCMFLFSYLFPKAYVNFNMCCENFTTKIS